MDDLSILGIRVRYDTVRSSEAALESMAEEAKRTEGLVTRAADRMSAAFVTMGSRANGSSSRLSASTSRVRNLGNAAQNASFQVADFFVQIGAGTSVTQSLAQQLPQLLGGMGLMGAAAGALVAVVGGLWLVFGETKTAAELLESALDDLDSEVSAYTSSVKEASVGTQELIDKFGSYNASARAVLDTLRDVRREQAELSASSAVSQITSGYFEGQRASDRTELRDMYGFNSGPRDRRRVAAQIVAEGRLSSAEGIDDQITATESLLAVVRELSALKGGITAEENEQIGNLSTLLSQLLEIKAAQKSVADLEEKRRLEALTASDVYTEQYNSISAQISLMRAAAEYGKESAEYAEVQFRQEAASLATKMAAAGATKDEIVGIIEMERRLKDVTLEYQKQEQFKRKAEAVRSAYTAAADELFVQEAMLKFGRESVEVEEVRQVIQDRRLRASLEAQGATEAEVQSVLALVDQSRKAAEEVERRADAASEAAKADKEAIKDAKAAARERERIASLVEAESQTLSGDLAVQEAAMRYGRESLQYKQALLRVENERYEASLRARGVSEAEVAGLVGLREAAQGLSEDVAQREQRTVSFVQSITRSLDEAEERQDRFTRNLVNRLSASLDEVEERQDRFTTNFVNRISSSLGEVGEAEELLDTLRSQAEIKRVIEEYGEGSLEATRARVDSEREAYEEMVAALGVSDDMKDSLMSAWDAANGLSATDIASTINNGADAAGRLYSNLAAAMSVLAGIEQGIVTANRRAANQIRVRRETIGDPAARAAGLQRESYNEQSGLAAYEAIKAGSTQDIERIARNTESYAESAATIAAAEVELQEAETAFREAAKASASGGGRKKKGGGRKKAAELSDEQKEAEREAKRVLANIERATLDAMSAQERYNTELEDLYELYQMGYLSAEQFQKGVSMAKEAMIDSQIETFNGWVGDLTEGLTDAALGFESLADVAEGALRRIAQSLVSSGIDLGIRSIVSAFTGGGPSAGSVVANTLSSAISGVASFEGGGRTKSGPRTGGVDGKGGMWAILHPDETISDDRLKGASSSGTTNITYAPTIDARGADPSVVERLRVQMEKDRATFEERVGIALRDQSRSGALEDIVG